MLLSCAGGRMTPSLLLHAGTSPHYLGGKWSIRTPGLGAIELAASWGRVSTFPTKKNIHGSSHIITHSHQYEAGGHYPGLPFHADTGPLLLGGKWYACTPGAAGCPRQRGGVGLSTYPMLNQPWTPRPCTLSEHSLSSIKS